MFQIAPNSKRRIKKKEYVPTLEEIKIGCKQIQDSWTLEEEIYRRTGLNLTDQLVNPIPHIKHNSQRKSNTVDKPN